MDWASEPDAIENAAMPAAEWERVWEVLNENNPAVTDQAERPRWEPPAVPDADLLRRFQELRKLAGAKDVRWKRLEPVSGYEREMLVMDGKDRYLTRVVLYR